LLKPVVGSSQIFSNFAESILPFEPSLKTHDSFDVDSCSTFVFEITTFVKPPREILAKLRDCQAVKRSKMTEGSVGKRWRHRSANAGTFESISSDFHQSKKFGLSKYP
jgi:hypothetical protein